LDVLSEVRGHDASWLGVIAGADQGARTALEEQARALGLLPDHVFFTGESDRVPALLARSDLLVLCSECEGFPNILLEAMAARLPVVTMRAGDAARIVQHGITGYVVESVDQMPDCIIRLGRSRALRQQMGEAGRERVEQEYRCEMLPERLLRLFETFAQDRNRTGLARLLEEVLQQMHSDASPLLCGSPFSRVE